MQLARSTGWMAAAALSMLSSIWACGDGPTADHPRPAEIRLLSPIDAPYAVVSVALRLSPSGLASGTYAPYTLSSASGRVGTGGSVPTDSVWTLDRFPPDSYNIEWAEVTVDEVTYLPTPATITMTLDPRLEPYEFAALYTPAP